MLSAVILLMHLVRRTPLTGEGAAHARAWLLLGLGVLPIGTAATANVAGFQAMESRKFCGSCHVMQPQASDSEDRNSRSLAAIHARNGNFGHENCYSCHKDYGMYGYVMTKAGGMRHVYLYLTEYRKMSLEESKREIRIMKPVPNANCMFCHTTEAPGWLKVRDHASALEDIRSDKVGCASPGCHGYAHPLTKTPLELEKAKKENPEAHR